MRFFEWNSCLLFSPKGERENNCVLQYASFVISNFSVFPDVLVWIWSIHWNVKSDSTWRVRLKCMATSQVCLFYIIICIYFFSCLFCIIICIFFFPVINWLTSGFAYATVSLNWFTVVYKPFVINLLYD